MVRISHQHWWISNHKFFADAGLQSVPRTLYMSDVISSCVTHKSTPIKPVLDFFWPYQKRTLTSVCSSGGWAEKRQACHFSPSLAASCPDWIRNSDVLMQQRFICSLFSISVFICFISGTLRTSCIFKHEKQDILIAHQLILSSLNDRQYKLLRMTED